MRSLAVPALVALALASPALAADEPSVVWTLLDVHAFLDNDGAVHVRETHHVQLTGAVQTIQRGFACDTDQSVRVTGVWRVRADESRREALTAGDPAAPGHYALRLDAVEWSVRAPGSSEIDRSPIFEVEYDFTNAVTPAWDPGAGPRPLSFTMAFVSPAERWTHNAPRLAEAWPILARAYRFDHDVLFPNLNRPVDEVRQIDYHVHYDEAWRMVTPEAQLATATADVDYRVRVILEYLRPGRPAAANVRNAAIRTASIVALPIAGVAMLIVCVLGSIAWTAPRLDREWIEKHLLALAPEIVRAESGAGAAGDSLERLLTRMAAARRIRIQIEKAATDEDAAEVSMRLLSTRESLAPVERAVVDALFFEGGETSTKAVQARYRREGFDPDEVIDAAVEAATLTAASQATSTPASARLSRRRAGTPWRPLASTLSLLLILAGLALLVADVLKAHQPPVALFSCLILNSVVSEAVSRGRTRIDRSRLLDVLLIAPLLVLTIAVTAMHLSVNTALSVYASAGLALFTLGVYQSILNKARPAARGVQKYRQRDLARARAFAASELKKARPALEDAWIPHLEALGLGGALEAWRRRHAGVSSGLGAMTADSPSIYTFTGVTPGSASLPPGWADGFTVYEADEDEDEPGEDRDGDEGVSSE